MASGIDRRRFALGSAGVIASGPALAAGDNNDAPLQANVLRVLFESAETGFDPAQVSDLYSSRVTRTSSKRSSATTRSRFRSAWCR